MGSLINLTVVAMTQGDHATARTLLERALEYEAGREGSGDSLIRAVAAIHFAEIANNDGDTKAAMGHLKQALATALTIRHQLLIIGCLSMTGLVGSRSGDAETAVLLLAATDTARTASGFSAEAISDSDVREAMAILESRLDQVTIDATWTKGAELSLAQAAEMAKSFLDDMDIGVSQNDEPARLPAEAAALTPREREILRLLADGRSNQDIADALFISLRTAQTHVAHILAKLKLASRAAAAAYSVRQGLV